MDPLLKDRIEASAERGLLTERLVQPALHAIREAIEGIEDGDASEDALTILAPIGFSDHGVQRGIEIVSEAARRIPPELQASQPNIPWAQIVGIGNVLRHERTIASRTALIWNVGASNIFRS